MKWATALRTEPPHPVLTLVSKQQKHSQTPAVSASTWRQHLSLIRHFCSLSSQRRTLCSCSFVHWLAHYSCNPCSTRSLARRSVWGDTPSQHAGLFQASDWVGGWPPIQQGGKATAQWNRDASTAVLRPSTPHSHTHTPTALEGVAWLTPRHILSGKSSSGLGSGLG